MPQIRTVINAQLVLTLLMELVHALTVMRVPILMLAHHHVLIDQLAPFPVVEQAVVMHDHLALSAHQELHHAQCD